MKRFSEQFNTAAKRVTMTKAESRELRERLIAYMEYHPLPAERKVAQPAVLMSEPYWVWRFNTVRTRAFATVFAIATFIIVPIAAEQTVPGDVLYPVKVRFNEEVRSSLAVTPYQQIEWETRRVERRLAEARLLATEGKLTAAIENEVAAAVKTHSDAAQAGLAELRATDSEEAAIAELTFASALEVESEVLESETERQQAAGATTTATLALAIADARAQVARPETTEVSFPRLLAQVEAETTRANELLLSLAGDITMIEREDIDRRLADIDRKISEALTYQTEQVADVAEVVEEPVIDLESETTATSSATTTEVVVESEIEIEEPAPVAPSITETEAKALLRAALSDTQKLIRFMTDIDVKANVTVEELIPVTPTPEEAHASVQNQRNTVTAAVATITARNSSDEKVVAGLATVANLLERASSTAAIGDFAAASVALMEAKALTDDMVAMTEGLLIAPPATAATSTPATSTEEFVEEPEGEAGIVEPAEGSEQAETDPEPEV